MTTLLSNRVAVIAVATAVIAAATLAMAGPDAQESRNVLTVERIYATPSLTGTAPLSLRWMNDSKRISYLFKVGAGDDTQTHLMVADVPSGKSRTLCIVDTIAVPEDLRKEDDDKFKISSYRWAEKGDYGWFTFGGDIFTINNKSGAIERRTTTEVAEGNIDFSPDGTLIAFTRDNDLYLYDIAASLESRLTSDGNVSLLNGVLDWVYMEELFTRGNVKAHWWSPDGSAIAYLQIDEAPVHDFPIVDFIPEYNTVEMQHYPKAGSENPIVKVGVYILAEDRTQWIDIDTTDDSYIARVYWLGDSRRVAIEKLNRNQDRLTLYFADTSAGTLTQILEEQKPTWINISYMKHYYETKDYFLWESERSGFAHLYLYKNDGTLVGTVTEGDWGVTELNDVDEKRGHVYFTGLKTNILERHIYRAGEKGGKVRQLSQRTGTHSAVFSPNHRYYIDTFSNTTTPRVISVHNAEGKEMFIVDQSNPAELAKYNLPAKEFFTFTSKEGFEFYCSMIKPNDFDPTKKYPVLVYTYGGPHVQVVRNRWGGTRGLWHQYMAQRGYIIFSLDNRGSFGRGTAWEDPILEDMGRVEVEDQATGVEYLKTLPYVDPSRIGIWGWSYGGYMTSMAMFKAPGVFRTGASVAPVTDWRFYDTIYTERYMKKPQDNEEGYTESAPINFVDGLQGEFMLVHGTADDNVHMANAMTLADALIKADKQFDLMVYPRKLHGISGQSSRVHLYKMLTAFFDETLLAEEPDPTVP